MKKEKWVFVIARTNDEYICDDGFPGEMSTLTVSARGSKASEKVLSYIKECMDSHMEDNVGKDWKDQDYEYELEPEISPSGNAVCGSNVYCTSSETFYAEKSESIEEIEI